MKKIIILTALSISLATGVALAAAKYKVVCPDENNKVLKYDNDYDRIKQWSDNHNTGKGHSSYVDNN